MNLKTVKTRADIALTGVEIEIERTDNYIVGVVLADAKGNRLIVRKGEYGGIQVVVPAPPPMVKKYRITGELRGLKYDETFDTREAAAERLRVITDAAYIGSESDAIQEIEVAAEDEAA